jgi:glycosyltransferase involved in cell wall biosynthesis
MRIAQVAPLAEAVPPKLYGGTERVVSWLTEELVRKGHEVTLFASGDSNTIADLVPCAPRGLRLSGIRDTTAHLLVMLDQVRQRADEFELIHFHIDLLQFQMFKDIAFKCLTTLHGRLDLPDYHPIYRAFPDMPLVSISDRQRAPVRDANWMGTVYHGMPPDLIRCNPDGGHYLAFIGRISPEKRLDRAIEIARRVGLPLKIAAKVDIVDQDYFNTVISPLLEDPLVEFVGEIDDVAKGSFLGNALALLFPVDWPEPFGLAMIEAMAAGTPVIAWRVGSVPEVIDDGSTGIIVESIDEAVRAVERVQVMSRVHVRSQFEKRFTVADMAQIYVSLYEQLLAMERMNGAACAFGTRRLPTSFVNGSNGHLALLKSPPGATAPNEDRGWAVHAAAIKDSRRKEADPEPGRGGNQRSDEA